MTEPSRAIPSLMDRNRALLDHAQTYEYKQTAQGALEAHVYGNVADGTARPAILFFYSSLWDSGLISQFCPHAMHFAELGMVSIIFDYRTSQKHGTTPIEAMADARTAIRWARFHSEALGIDPNKLCGIGASGGGQLLLSTAMCGTQFNDSSDNVEISCRPDALVLFSPIVDLLSAQSPSAGKFGTKTAAKLASPLHCMAKGLPPMLIIHGTADRLVPFSASEKFKNKATSFLRRNKVELVSFEGQGHGFFNFNVDPRLFEITLHQTDDFLQRHGWMETSESPSLSDSSVNLRLASDGRIEG